MYRHLALAFVLSALLPTFTQAENPWVLISMDQRDEALLKTLSDNSYQVLEKLGGYIFIQIHPNNIPALSLAVHQNTHRCGGFIAETSVEDAIASNQLAYNTEVATQHVYTPSHPEIVKPVINLVNEQAIRATIERLSGFKNRFYRSETGVASQEWIKSTWAYLTRSIPNASTSFVHHSGYAQPSVLLTIPGSQYPDEIIVLGGHGDSISGYGLEGGAMNAPGADDNASGVAVLTEIIRIISETGYRPARTLQFFSYAAEEVGLYGSKDIATRYKNLNYNVLGVMQFDMTNYRGSSKDMYLMTDFTNAPQNEFLKQIVKAYIPHIQVGESKCGYACSDHASWTRAGFASSIPFESSMSEDNPKIHTPSDTLSQSGGHARHAIAFAQLGLAFALEMGSI